MAEATHSASKSFTRRLDALPEVLDFVAAFVARAAIGEANLSPAQLVVEELFTNLVKYNPDGSGDLRIDLVREGGELVFRLTDSDTEPFDIRNAPEVDTDLPLEKRRPGGLGIHLVRRLSTGIDYAYNGRCGTTTVRRKLE